MAWAIRGVAWGQRQCGSKDGVEDDKGLDWLMAGSRILRYYVKDIHGIHPGRKAEYRTEAKEVEMGGG